MQDVKPDEVYNLGAQSHVRVSFDQPIFTADVVATGVLKMLEAVRAIRTRAASRPLLSGQLERDVRQGRRKCRRRRRRPSTRARPTAARRSSVHWITVNYRESYNMHASCGILFNHESPRRGETFVTRKITRAVGRIKLGMQKKLFLGNLDALRDWGFAGDYVDAMWRMLQQPTADDYVVSTGKMISVRTFCELAFGHVGLDYKDFVEIDPRYFRPAEVDILLADPTKAREKLDWTPTVPFTELVRRMVEHDMRLAAREKRAAEV
jgi:GDPmannose 4,6-dehydratase